MLLRKDVAAALEYYTEFGVGENVYRPAHSYYRPSTALGPPVEKDWQKEVRHYDLNGVGILGNSLDMIASTASRAQFIFVDPYSEESIPDSIFQSKVMEPIWRDGKDLSDAVALAVRNISSVGEFDLVFIDGQYDIFQISQRVEETDNVYLDREKTRLKSYGTITYRQRDDEQKSRVTVSKQHVERCYVPQPDANREATAPTRRVLPQLRLYSQIMTQFLRIAAANSLMTKVVYGGEDPGDWLHDERYMSQFQDPSKAVPPIVNDMANQANRIRSGGALDPWWIVMGPSEPAVLDLTTSFDEQAREQLKQCNNEIALGLNIPAKVLLGEDVTHFVEWSQNEQFRTQAVSPPLETVLKFFDKHIYSHIAQKHNYSAKLWYSFNDLSSMSLNPAQMIELFKIGAIGSKGIQRLLKLSDADSVLSPEDERRRRELLTGDSGLQQAQLAERDAQRSGQERQAAPDSAPLTNGNMRQGNEGQGDVAAALDIKKKISKL